MKKRLYFSLIALTSLFFLLVSCGPNVKPTPEGTKVAIESSIDFGEIKAESLPAKAEKSVVATTENFSGNLEVSVGGTDAASFTTSVSKNGDQHTIKIAFVGNKVGIHRANLVVKAGTVAKQVEITAMVSVAGTPMTTDFYFIYDGKNIPSGGEFTVKDSDFSLEEYGEPQYAVEPHVLIKAEKQPIYICSFKSDKRIPSGSWCFGEKCVSFPTNVAEYELEGGAKVAPSSDALQFHMGLPTAKLPYEAKITFTIKNTKNNQVYTATMIVKKDK